MSVLVDTSVWSEALRRRKRVEPDVESEIDLSPEWKTEIEKRCREVDEGTVALIDAAEVFDKAYAKLS